MKTCCLDVGGLVTLLKVSHGPAACSPFPPTESPPFAAHVKSLEHMCRISLKKSLLKLTLTLQTKNSQHILIIILETSRKYSSNSFPISPIFIFLLSVYVFAAV